MTSGYETSLQFKIARGQDITTKKIYVAVYEVVLYTRDAMFFFSEPP